MDFIVAYSRVPVKSTYSAYRIGKINLNQIQRYTFDRCAVSRTKRPHRLVSIGQIPSLHRTFDFARLAFSYQTDITTLLSLIINVCHSYVKTYFFSCKEYSTQRYSTDAYYRSTLRYT